MTFLIGLITGLLLAYFGYLAARPGVVTARALPFREFDKIYRTARNDGIQSCADLLSKFAETSKNKEETLRYSKLVLDLRVTVTSL